MKICLKTKFRRNFAIAFFAGRDGVKDLKL